MFLLNASRYCVHTSLSCDGTRRATSPVVVIVWAAVPGMITVESIVAIGAALPGDVACVTFRFAALFAMGIVNTDHSDSIVAAGALFEKLFAVTIDSLKVKVICSGG